MVLCQEQGRTGQQAEDSNEECDFKKIFGLPSGRS